MKLKVRKLWFRHDVEKVVRELFRIPQIREQFSDGWEYDCEMRPKGLKMPPLDFWPANEILELVPRSQEDVYLVLTSRDLRVSSRTARRIHGKGEYMKAISSNHGFIDGHGYFDCLDTEFLSTTFGEIGHALGLSHHLHNPEDPCEMSHNERPKAKWESLRDIQFCSDCYGQLRKG